MKKKLFVSNKDESARMFESDFMEFFTKVHWTVPLWLYVPIILIMLYLSAFTFNISILNILLLFVAGVIFWTFTEYILHRFLFHYHPKSEIGKKIFWTFHGVHHDYPQDSKRLVMPPSVSIPLATIFYFLFYFVFPNNLNLPFFSGFLIGYLIYDISHYAIHHFAFRNKFFLKIKKHHMTHHYVSPDEGFGVSSPFWDDIFKTNFKTKDITKNP